MANQPYMDQIGPYKVLEEIGRGGMATVFRVTNPEGDEYALKLLHYGSQQDARWGTRFQREFRLLSRLRHPHLIEVHDYGEDHDQAYYVMNYIEGTTLWGLYREKLRNLPIVERLRWLLPLTGQVISALDYIHRHRVVHQDIKPANILLSKDNQTAYLADFGLAREVKGTYQYTHAGFVGTLGYAAPEIVERARLDGRADIYSLGVVLYTVMADCRPIQVEGRPLEQVVNAVLNEEPTPLEDIVDGIPTDVASLVHRCIQKDPNDRFRSTRELWQEIFPIITSFQQQATVHLPVPDLPQQEAVPLSQPWMESQLIGRREELSVCQLRLEQLMKNQQGSATIFYGIPGIGKTYLLEELTRIARRFNPRTFAVKLRPQAPPFGSLSEMLRQLLSEFEPQQYMGDAYNQLAYYVPDLPHATPMQESHLPPLVDPVQDVTQRLNAFLNQLFTAEGQICLIDDLQNADIASQEILKFWMSFKMVDTTTPFCLFATVSYAPGGESPSFRLSDHERVESMHLLPFSEEEEQDYMEQLLGRPPTDHEYLPIRSVSRGIPLRTYELIHQNDLLHQLQSKNELVGIPGLQTRMESGPEIDPPTRNVSAGAFEAIPISASDMEDATALQPILSELSTLSHAAKISTSVLESLTQQAPELQVEKLSPPPGGLAPSVGIAPETTEPELAPLPAPPVQESGATQRAPLPPPPRPRPPSIQTVASPAPDLDDDEAGESTVLVFSPADLLPAEPETKSHTLDVDEAAALALQDDILEMEVDEDTGEHDADAGESTALYIPDLHSEINHTLQRPSSSDILIDPLQPVALQDDGEGESTTMQVSPFANLEAAEPTRTSRLPQARSVSLETDDEVPLDSQLQTIALREDVEVGDVTMLHAAPTQLRGTPPPLESVRAPVESGNETMIGGLPANLMNASPSMDDLGERTALVAPLSESLTPLSESLAESTMLVSPLRELDSSDSDEEPTAFFRSVDLAKELFEKKQTETQTPVPSAPVVPEDPTPERFSESSEELVLIPLLQRRLEMLGEERQKSLVYGTFLGDAFTIHELCMAAGITQDDALDLLNLALSLRILEVHSNEHDEQYAFLYPIFRRLLTADITLEERKHYATQAATSMSQHREAYHRSHNASLLAMRFSEAEQPIEALRWQLFSVQQTLQSLLPEAQMESLIQLFQLLQYWSNQGATTALHQALPGLFQQLVPPQSGLWDTACYRLLWVGCLYAMRLPQQAQTTSPQAQQSVRTLMQHQARSDSSQISKLYQRLHPLLQFARLDFVSQA